MKRIAYLCLALLLMVSFATPARARDGQVIYQAGSEKFFFLPGTIHSPTDLFPDFKNVMPGDTLTQAITLKNDVSNNCKIKVYLRALGGHEDSEAFLSQLRLTVTKDTDTVLFDATAEQSAQLTDWVYLGTLYSGGKCQLTVTLEVPVTLDNSFKNLVGYLDWEFAVEELPVENTDPPPPQTGDTGNLTLWFGLMGGSVLLLLILLLLGRKKKKEEI